MSSWPVARLQAAGPSGEVQIARLFEGRINPGQILPALARKGVRCTAHGRCLQFAGKRVAAARIRLSLRA